MRFIPHSQSDVKDMLAVIGAADVEELLAAIPEAVRLRDDGSDPGLSEQELDARYRGLAALNRPLQSFDSFLGGGSYAHYIPAAVDQLASKPEFLTSYTQYQPESNQGMLQALFEYQTLMCRLTAMEVSNASHYDGGTSLVEAVWMAVRERPGPVIYSRNLHPHYRRMLQTYMAVDPGRLLEIAPPSGVMTAEDLPVAGPVAALIVQTPNFTGCLEPLHELSDRAHALGALVIAAVYPIALGILEPPGTQGADIVVGEGQSLGQPMQFGGPTFGFLLSRREFMRKMPGRIVGLTRDSEGRAGYVLTLQTREQHIRREKAVSNICTNQALCALRAGIYLAYQGPFGLRKVSATCFERAHRLAEALNSIPGVRLLFDQPFFNEFAIHCGDREGTAVLKALRGENILGGLALSRWYPEMKNDLLIAVTETNGEDSLERFQAALQRIMSS